MLRSVLAVLAGPIVYGIVCLPANWLIVSLFPAHFDDRWVTQHTGLLILLVSLTIVYAGAAGYATAWIARGRGRTHVSVVAVVMLVIGVAVQSQFWNDLPLWYHLSFFVLIVAGVLLGGRLRLAAP